MGDRSKYIAKRRAVLKDQITGLLGLLTHEEIDSANVHIRFKRLTELFHAYEELHIELELIESTPENTKQLNEVQDSYYELATLVAELSSPANARANADATHLASGFANSTLTERQKQVKLPIADLPKFNGNRREWIAFKNSFMSMIGNRTDIDDCNKFVYLRSCLTGSASNKLALYTASAENYKRGLKLLTELYEEKRILITGHYAGIFDNGYCKITPMQSASADALSKLIDDAQQHISMLESLEVVPDEGMIVYFLERALPTEIRNEWRKTLSPDTMPTFKQFYKYIHGCIVRIEEDGNEAETPHNKQSGKRSHGGNSQSSKARKSDSGARTLLTNASVTCPLCGQNHTIHKCASFEKLNLSQRWDMVKAKSLCSNCLREHKPPCKSSHCRRCERFHHTLLHNEKRNAAKGGDKTPGGTA